MLVYTENTIHVVLGLSVGSHSDLEGSEDRNKKPKDPTLHCSTKVELTEVLYKRVSSGCRTFESAMLDYSILVYSIYYLVYSNSRRLGNASTLKSIVANGHTTTISTLWRERTLTTRVLRRVESSTDFSLSKTGRPDMDITLLYDLPFYARSTIPFLLGIHRDIPNTF